MTNVILRADSTLYQAFEELIGSQRLVFFAGLPGVGKSLLLQQLALMAHLAGRRVHLLQWDVIRQPFVTDAYVLTRYPEVDGITHGAVRKAAGLWVRAAIGQWFRHHSDSADMLIGECPLIGNRLIELVQHHDDDVEPILCSPTAKFIIPVPSREVRRTIEEKREASSANPQHERENADAMPQVLQAAWLEVYRVAPELNITHTDPGHQGDYDPEIYQGVYSLLLKHRHSQRLPLTVHLPTEDLSVYDLYVRQRDLAPSMDDVRTYMAQVEELYRDMTLLDQEIDRWYIV
jgi:hypothetical protein